MKNLHNIEKSFARAGEYVGLCVGPWRITRTKDGWRALYCGTDLQPHQTTWAATLTELSVIFDRIARDHAAKRLRSATERLVQLVDAATV